MRLLRERTRIFLHSVRHSKNHQNSISTVSRHERISIVGANIHLTAIPKTKVVSDFRDMFLYRGENTNNSIDGGVISTCAR